LGRAKLEPERDEALLCAVVQVALDAAASFVGGGDHAGTGGRELGSALGIRDRRRDKLSESG
jgi:hypothetical protein